MFGGQEFVDHYHRHLTEGGKDRNPEASLENAGTLASQGHRVLLILINRELRGWNMSPCEKVTLLLPSCSSEKKKVISVCVHWLIN